MESPDTPRSTDEEVPPPQAPEDLPSRLQSIVRSLQASPRVLRRALDARLRSAESPSSSPGSPSLGRRLISRLLPAATPSSVASSGGGEESYGGPCSTSSSSAPTSSGANLPSGRPEEVTGTPVRPPPGSHHPMTVPEIVLQAPEGSNRRVGGDGEDGSGSVFEEGGETAPPIRPTALEPGKLLTLAVCGGGGSGGSSTVMDGGGSEASVVVVGVAAAMGGGDVEGGISIVPARKSPVTVQEWVDSLPHSGATTPVPHEASLPGALHCRSEEEEGEERAGLAGEGASAVPGDMVEDGLSLGAEAGHLYTGSVTDEVMCPRQRLEGSPPPPAPASQTSRRERPGGGSSATAKRREAFAGRREAEGGGGSFQSDSHSPASHSSIDSLLESRRPDPEEMLFGLGFGGSMGASPVPGGAGSAPGSQRGLPSPFPFGSCGPDGGSDDEVSRIPRRFLQPSKVKGVAINDFFKYQQDLIETFESGFCGYRGLTGPSHAVPSVIVAKIMEKLREHERECSSRGSVTSYGTGPVCQSPTPPPTPPFSPTNNYVGSPLGDDRIQFLQQHSHQHSPIVSPVESQPTTKFSKVARNVMHRSSVLTRMSSTGGESVMSADDGPGIACSPTGRATLSVLTPDNRRFLDSQGGKSPEMPRKRMIIGQKSFTFGNDGDLIEDVSQPPTPTSPTLPSKPPLLHKDSVLSSIASLTSCDSDSDTDSVPNVRRSGSSKSGSSHKPPSKSRTGSDGIEIGPWPLGKRVSSTSLSSWEEGEGQLSSSYTHGPRTRFLSIDEGDDENLENENESKKERWVLGGDSGISPKWNEGDSHGTNEHSGSLVGLNVEESRLGRSDKVEESILAREDSMNEGLWELELDQPEDSEYKGSVPSLPQLQGVNHVVPSIEGEKDNCFKPISVEDEVIKLESNAVQRLQSDLGNVEVGGDEICAADDSVPQDTQVPSNLSSSNFSSFSSMQDSCLTPASVRRGSLKRQTKIEIEEEKVEEVRRTVEVVKSALDELSCPSQPAGEPPEESSSQPTQEVPSAKPEPPKQPSVVTVVEEAQVVKKEMEGSSAKEEEKQKRALSPQGRSGSAHSDSSGFLEWEPPNMRISSTPQMNPLCQNNHSVESSKGREWMSAESNQLPSPDGVATMASSGYYGVEGHTSDMTGQPQSREAMDIDIRSLKGDLGENSRSESQDGTGREVALGGGDISECSMSDEGNDEEALQLAHRELCFVREMRCCVSEGMERVMQFLGTWSKRRHYRLASGGETDGESAQISSLVSQMTFLLKQQSQLCHEMEQISMQRLLDGQQLGGNFRRDSIPGVKGNSPVLGGKELGKNDAVIVQRKSEGDLYRPSTSQLNASTSASSKEKHLEGLVEKNAKELAELRLLLRAVLLTNQNDRGK